MTTWIWVGIIFALLVVLGLARHVLRGRCPKCRTPASFRKTGMTRVPGNVWGADLFEEYRCRECGHSEWIRRRSTLR